MISDGGKQTSFFKREENKEEAGRGKWRDGVYLATVSSVFEADMLISMLAAEGIPALRKQIGAGNYVEIVMGAGTVCEIEIYVPEEALSDARNIYKLFKSGE